MNKFLYFTCALLISTFSYADCLCEKPICPTTICPLGTFMGDDGICYDCYSDKTVSIRCMEHDEVFKRCPNRYSFSDCCDTLTGLTCLNKSAWKLKLMSIIYDEWTEGKNYIDFNSHSCTDHWGEIY